MANKKLYIIGNGFDLHHKIRSSYTEFGKYVDKTHCELFDTFEKYFSFSGNWSNLEESLAHIDVYSIIEDASVYLKSYAAEKWSDAYHHDYQYETNRIVQALSEKLKMVFTEWVLSLDIPNESTCTVPLLNIDKSATFLSFNYTDTLQKLYRIPLSKVLHIHNRAVNANSDLVLGHAVNPQSLNSLNSGVNNERQDPRVTEANEIIDRYFSVTYKPTTEIINRNVGFFKSLAGIDEIYVVGHSMSEVDIKYFDEIVKHTSNNNPVWVVTYYNKSDMSFFCRVLARLGVSTLKFKFVHIALL